MQDFDKTLNYSWRIATTTQGISFNPGESVETDFNVLLNNFHNDIGTGTFSLTVDAGKDLVLEFTPGQVPEPTAAAMTTLGFLLLFAKFRVRRNSREKINLASRPVVRARVQPGTNSVPQPACLSEIGLNAFISRC